MPGPSLFRSTRIVRHGPMGVTNFPSTADGFRQQPLDFSPTFVERIRSFACQVHVECCGKRGLVGGWRVHSRPAHQVRELSLRVPNGFDIRNRVQVCRQTAVAAQGFNGRKKPGLEFAICQNNSGRDVRSRRLSHVEAVLVPECKADRRPRPPK